MSLIFDETMLKSVKNKFKSQYGIDAPLQVIDDLLYECGRFGDEFNDNYRIARKSNKKEMDVYNSILKKGCCGFIDVTTRYNNEVWCIGCNYGH